MSATVNDPFLLSAYSPPSSTKNRKGKSVAIDERPYVFATHSAVPKREDGQVTLAVQGDGIHVFDLAELHPISSHTLGPSTSFASAPATLIVTEDGKSFRRTYVAVQAAQDVNPKDAGKVIWSWKEEINGEIGSSQDRQSFTLPHDVSYMVASQDSQFMVAVAPNGQLTQLDLNLNVLNGWSPGTDSQEVLKLFVFSRRDCCFFSGDFLPDDTVLMMFTTREKELLVRIIIFGQGEGATALEPQSISVEGVDKIADVSCDASGHFTVLESSGLWSPFTINVRNGVASISSTSKPLRLRGLDLGVKKKSRACSQASILSLGSSYVLLAGLTGSPDITLLLWDVQYGVLLHSHTCPIPSTLEKNPSMISVSLVRGSSTQALLVLSPRNAGSGPSQFKLSVLVVPYAVPRHSTIASAMGRTVQSAPWLVPERPAVATEDVNSSPQEIEEKERLLSRLQDAVEEERIDDAENIFFYWAKRKDEKAKGKVVAPVTENGGEAGALQEGELKGDELSKTQETKKSPYRRTYDHAFVTRVFQIALQPENAPGKPYSPKICRYLLSRNFVSYSMVDGGLLTSLVQRNDWETIRECFVNVVDITESDLLRALHGVVDLNRTRPLRDEDAMAVDQLQNRPVQTKTPSISSFLAYVVEYPASQLAWRKALREHFADVDDLMSLLVVIDDWMQIYITKDLPLELGEVTNNEHGVPVVCSGIVHKKPIRIKNGGLLPALENVLSFLQAILDSCFLTLLQSPQTHMLLQRLAANIAPHTAVNEDLETLRGPLTPFASAQVKALTEASGGKKTGETDWRRRRKNTQEQAAINLGPYQVEELVF
ncbi:hypothetical protein M0805_006093 [Coniferiporia weirii]|nr:hypothetical protein M0805_006093 [Coniferiporia weirii]